MRAHDDIEKRLAEELSDMAPNRLDELLAACGEQPERAPVQELPRRRPHVVRRALAAAAVLALLLCGALGYRAADLARCVVTFDVNPSVSLSVNRFDRVRDVAAQNADAQTLLDGLSLQNKPLDTAVSALTDALADAGYLDGQSNAMLVSVQGADESRAEELCTQVVEAAESAAKARLFHAAVLFQRLSDEDASETGAAVSDGKSAAARALAGQLTGASEETLQALSVQELLYLAQSRDVLPENSALYGTVSAVGYCTGAEAAADALEGAGLAADAAYTLTYTCQDGALAYVIEFSDDAYAYSYTVEARSGNVLEVRRTALDSGETAQSTPADPDDALSEVLARVNATEEELEDLDVQVQWVEDTPTYRITFDHEGQPYRFFLDAELLDDIF